MQKPTLQISGKIWLSISFVVVGYFFSTLFTVYLGTETVGLLETAADQIFPATRLSQRALSSFETQMKLYEDGVVIGETGYIEQAGRIGRRGQEYLRSLGNMDGLPETQLDGIRTIAAAHQRFMEEANRVYGQLAEGNEATEDLQTAAAALAQSKILLEKKIGQLAADLSNQLKAQLRDVTRDTNRAQFFNVLTFVLAMLASGFLMHVAIQRLITRPLGRTVDMLEELDQGKLDNRLEIKTHDEIGRMARALDGFADSLQAKVRLAQHIADGDLTVDVPHARPHDALGRAMHAMVVNLKANQTQIEQSIQNLEAQAIALKQANDLLIDEVAQRQRAQSKLAETQVQLVAASRQAGMAEVATGVLHNVGNILNSVNVSATIVGDKINQSELEGLQKAVSLLEENTTTLSGYLTEDPKGAQLPRYLALVANRLDQEHREVLLETETLIKNISHIRDIVALQQSYAKVSNIRETTDIAELIADALHINKGALERHGIEVGQDIDVTGTVLLEKQKILQVLVNLIKNSADSLGESPKTPKRLNIVIKMTEPDRLSLRIEDNGIGIPPENLTRIFAHGFTTKKQGHGFGLHTGALAIAEMGGTLRAESDGHNRGASFILELPTHEERETDG